MKDGNVLVSFEYTSISMAERAATGVAISSPLRCKCVHDPQSEQSVPRSQKTCTKAHRHAHHCMVQGGAAAQLKLQHAQLWEATSTGRQTDGTQLELTLPLPSLPSSQMLSLA